MSSATSQNQKNLKLRLSALAAELILGNKAFANTGDAKEWADLCLLHAGVSLNKALCNSPTLAEYVENNQDSMREIISSVSESILVASVNIGKHFEEIKTIQSKN